ncbi:MAG: pyridoxal phosphate-dependent aminotransferase [Desulfobacula sp.]|jgi:aminotransferase|uniref:pyridoxal phosphate-dependent aminotransferase n=1 Tax=Desulfobacula sp. TaxID=2593537 RepID=UPI001D3C5FAD|nr:pyridoxal phosphate-dependent aminotransferase [Desulfobacula sp.]MBT3485151.1 pyridoxal phosphate-dependent aminotransferase [Desulfobacula sp.]MBT3804104.1 pyridoxal phosphate-dependent aminotransferase [Desulfobacula sp.]MBT4025355.1 pyridoxal phosphate-dependent aminotransferase [Desulfobacula sp.]MBT4199493.1 pyridoxal phosphate-dependent aminotransferase [Desulfobacula sp.]
MKLAKRMDIIPFQRIRIIVEEVTRRERLGEKIIHLEIGRPDFDTPSHIKEAAIEAISKGKVHYTSNYGIIELRNEIAAKFKQDNGLTYDPLDEIIVTVGATEGIFLSMMALLDPGDEVLIFSPSFPAYAQCANMIEAIPVFVPLKQDNDFEPIIEDLKSKITSKTKMIVINTPHNPTGAVYSEKTLTALAQIALENDLLVLSDEIYEKNIYDGYEHFSIASLPGMQERTITLNGFSKSHCMTGWRLGYLASSKEIIGGLIRIHQYATVCATSFAQHGAVAALKGPQDDVELMGKEFSRRRVMMVERLQKMPGLSVFKPKGAFYIFINVEKLGMTSQKLATYLLDEATMAVVPWGDKNIRISYANSYENLEKAMDNMEAALKKLKINYQK